MRWAGAMTEDGPVDVDRWPYAIGTLHLLKQQIGILAPAALIGVAPPRQAAAQWARDPAASDLPEDLQEWLAGADGWPDIWFGMRLLAASEIATADTDPEVQLRCKSSIPQQPSDNLLVVGCSDSREHLVVVTRNEHHDDPAGSTYWIEPDSIDEYASFYEFFCTLVELHRDELADLQPG